METDKQRWERAELEIARLKIVVRSMEQERDNYRDQRDHWYHAYLRRVDKVLTSFDVSITRINLLLKEAKANADKVERAYGINAK